MALRRFFRVRRDRGQSTIELALIIPLIAGFCWIGVTQFLNAHHKKETEIETRNEAMRTSMNGKIGFKKDDKILIPDMGSFDIPAGRSWDLPRGLFQFGANAALNLFGDDLFAKLGLDGTDSWWKSSIKGGIEAYIKSGLTTGKFDTEMLGYGAAHGLITSGDATGVFSDTFGTIAGAGVQGALAGAAISKGDWEYAMESGLNGMMDTDQMENLKGNFFVSTANGAALGALSGGAEGALKGGLLGATKSDLIQKPLGNLVGNKDYFVSSVNAGIYTAVTHGGQPGMLRAMLTNSAQAAFLAPTVQKGLFGNNPAGFLSSVSNATVTGGMSAIQNKDASMLYYSMAGGAVQGVISEAINGIYPPPEKGLTESPEDYAKKLEKHMSTQSFVSGMSTMGVAMLAGNDFAGGYAEMLGTQMAMNAIAGQIKGKKENKDKDNEITIDPDNLPPSKNQPSINHSKEDPPNPFARFQREIDYELKNFTENSRDKFSKIEDIPSIDSNKRYASAAMSDETITGKSPSDSDKNDQNEESGDREKMSDEEMSRRIFERLEAIEPDEVTRGIFYKQILDSKPLAKRILKDELKRRLKLVNALHLKSLGFVDDDIERLIGSKNFENALNKAAEHPIVEKRIDKVIDIATDPTTVRKVIVKLKERLIQERAFYAELQLRKLLWKYDKKSTIHSREKKRNIIMEIYQKISG